MSSRHYRVNPKGDLRTFFLATLSPLLRYVWLNECPVFRGFGISVVQYNQPVCRSHKHIFDNTCAERGASLVLYTATLRIHR